MINKIFYWCPFIDKVATIQAVINSAYSIAKYDKKYKPIILNTVGEWDKYEANIHDKKIQIENLTDSKILNTNSKTKGFFRSRILYFKIIFRLLFPLINF